MAAGQQCEAEQHQPQNERRRAAAGAEPVMRSQTTGPMAHGQGANGRQEQVGEAAGDGQSRGRYMGGAISKIVAGDERRQQNGIGERQGQLRQDKERKGALRLRQRG
jgi:hypothetical protein